MRVLVEGHRYQLDNFVDPNTPGQELQFIHKEPNTIQSNGNTVILDSLRLVSDGTTNEEVLAMLLDRMEYLNSKFPCVENDMAIIKLTEAKYWLEHRTANRKKAGVEGQHKPH